MAIGVERVFGMSFHPPFPVPSRARVVAVLLHASCARVVCGCGGACSVCVAMAYTPLFRSET